MPQQSINIVVEAGVAAADFSTLAPKNNPTFYGNVTLPGSTTIGNVNPVELSYLDGVTSNIQSQINAINGVSALTGNLYLPQLDSQGTSGSIIFEGTTNDAYDVTLGLNYALNTPSQSVKISLPVDSADTQLVGTVNTQTLTNKTITSPTITFGVPGSSAPLQFNSTQTTNPTFSGTLTVPLLTSTSGIRNSAGAPYTPIYWNDRNGASSASVTPNTTDKYPIFDSSSKSLILQANSLYRFDGFITMTFAASTSSVSTILNLFDDPTGITISGSGTYTGTINSGSAGATNLLVFSSGILTPAANTSAFRTIRYIGTIRTGSSNATLKPSISFTTAPGQSLTFGGSCNILIQPLGAASDVAIGGWTA